MGFLDFFRRRRAKPPSRTGEGVFEQFELRQPRRQHYVFAHVALRQLAFEHGKAMMAVLDSPRAMALLVDLWAAVRKSCRDQGEPADLDPAGLSVEAVRAAGRPCVVVTMPAPEAVPEAHFVAVVAAGEANQVRYFTLEKGMHIEDNSPRTVLCEWTAEAAHLNYGDGPEASVHAFATAVGNILLGGGEVQASHQGRRD